MITTEIWGRLERRSAFDIFNYGTHIRFMLQRQNVDCFKPACGRLADKTWDIVLYDRAERALLGDAQ